MCVIAYSTYSSIVSMREESNIKIVRHLTYKTLTMAAAAGAKQTLKYVLGKCMPTFKSNAARIQIPVMVFDDYLNMHFRHFEYVFAHDPQSVCKTGDMVLVQSLPEKLTKLITHKVIEVIYPCGDITDPITGKKIAASKYREDVKEANQLFGESENAFDYDKALPRGSLEDKRDFTHKPAYKKWHEDPDDPQPYAV